MKLISIYEQPDRNELLYKLLGERDETINVSHKALPKWRDHVSFVKSHPYKAWYFILPYEGWYQIGKPVGACYLTKHDEIGIFIFKEYQHQGYGASAVKALIEKHGPLNYLANINPQNEKSMSLFAKLGFKTISHTLAFTP